MNKIAYLVAGVASAERGRARMKKIGATPNGDLLWTDEEDEILRKHQGDYQSAIGALGGRRTYFAVRNRSQTLGLSPRRSHWTGEQVMRLRRVYRSGTPEDIRSTFPDRSSNSIYKMAGYFGIRRPRKPFVRTGFPIIDQIRDKCFECAISMVDLDAMAGTGTYFSHAGWYSGRANTRMVAKAVKALGGELVARWDDAPDDLPNVTPMPRLMPGGRLRSAQVVRLAA